MVEVVGQLSLVMVKSAEARILLKVSVAPDLIMEGSRDAVSGFVEMAKESNIHYCVIQKVINRDEILFDSHKCDAK
jgi:hypothetical protein